MEPYLQDPDVTLFHGDVLDVLREMEAESVDCVVTSPPYWGLRDYGTGAWEGGDEGCDHKRPPRTEVVAQHSGRSGNASGSPPQIKDPTFYGAVCEKCGATRIDQQLGLEPTPEQYVTRMVEVFREVRRVLAAHGTVWLNLGDTFNSNPSWGRGRSTLEGRPQDQIPRLNHTKKTHSGLKEKDLVGIPWRVAFALQADGWYLRSDIIWAKPNPMPESVTDRPTKAHEYVFLLSRSPRYFFDQEAVREQFEARPQQRLTALKEQPLAAAREAAGVAQGNPQGGTQVSRFAVQKETLLYECQACGVVTTKNAVCSACGSYGDMAPLEEPLRGPDGRRNTHVEASDGSIQHRDGERWPNAGRNIRSVWEIATQPYPEAHFATFPEELARRCIAAGCPEQVCRVCGKARERIVESFRHDGFGHAVTTQYGEEGRHRDTALGARGSAKRHRTDRETLGLTDCYCGKDSSFHGLVMEAATMSDETRAEIERGERLHPKYRPGIVLDPFMGSGTVAHVARKLGRHAVGIDLNESYLELAARRLQQQSLFAEASGV